MNKEGTVKRGIMRFVGFMIFVTACILVAVAVILFIFSNHNLIENLKRGLAAASDARDTIRYPVNPPDKKWVLTRNPEYSRGRFIKRISEDGSVKLESREEVMFRISLTSPKGVPKDKFVARVVKYKGKNRILHVFKHTGLQFMLWEWMEAMKSEGFDYPTLSPQRQ